MLLAEAVKVGQRAAPAFNEAWSTYVEANGGGENDPSRRDEHFLKGFFELAGQHLYEGLSQGLSSGPIDGSGQQKRPRTDAGPTRFANQVKELHSKQGRAALAGAAVAPRAGAAAAARAGAAADARA